jgi:hypothetical protein
MSTKYAPYTSPNFLAYETRNFSERCMVLEQVFSTRGLPVFTTAYAYLLQYFVTEHDEKHLRDIRKYALLVSSVFDSKLSVWATVHFHEREIKN